MKIAIHQPQYMPWLGYFHKMAGVDAFVLLDDVQFKKNEWQHRNRIRNAQGFQWLSVPSEYSFGQRINDVRIKRDQAWEEKHLRSLEMCYGKAPFFHEYIDRFKTYFSRQRATMDSVTIDSVRLLAEMIDIAVPLKISSEYGFEGVSTERLVHICRHFGADTYLAGAGGHDYMDMTLFDKADIRVEFQQFTPPVYHQHWSRTPEDFIAGLSAIDLLFNCGPESRNVLMKKQDIAP